MYDEGQKITNAYGARNTPHIFLVKRNEDGNAVVYTGAIDNDPQNANTSKINYLQNAIDAILNNKNPEITTTKAIGCSVKKKKQ